tara:strand:- start:73 stop:327 length:255 start_codon:yes stop_codon:yes gene_type:complete
MKIFLLISLFIFGVFIFIKKVFSSAKRNLFKDQAAWSNKEIKIKYTKSKETSEPNGNDNFLHLIAEESKVFLEDQFEGKGHENS